MPSRRILSFLIVIFIIFMMTQIFIGFKWIYNRQSRTVSEHATFSKINSEENIEIDSNLDETENGDINDEYVKDEVYNFNGAPTTPNDSIYHNKEVRINDDLVLTFYYPESSDEMDEDEQKVIASNETEGWELIIDEHGHYYKRYFCPNSVYGKGNGKVSMYSSYWDMVHTKRAIFQMFSQYAEKLGIEWMPWLGSLVGTARDGYVVPWDGDVDISIRRKDLAKMEETPFPSSFDHFTYCLANNWRVVLQERRHKGFKGGCPMFGPVARIHDYHRKKKYTEILDIFTYDVREYEDGEKTVYSEFGIDEFEYDLIYPIRNCTFLSMTVPCPNQPRKVVEQIYDSEFKIPFACKDKHWGRVNEDVNRKPYFIEKQMFPGVNKTGMSFKVI